MFNVITKTQYVNENISKLKKKSLVLRLQLPSTKTLYTDNVLTKSQLVNNFVTEQNDSILMQFIGEVGASNVEELPDALNNLSIAKQMEWSGMGEQYIWATTGWVKGADGKWRMEIPDIINNLDFDNEKGIYERYEDYYPYPLKDFINEKIVRIYPQLSDYKIMFYSGSDVNEEEPIVIKLYV